MKKLIAALALASSACTTVPAEAASGVRISSVTRVEKTGLAVVTLTRTNTSKPESYAITTVDGTATAGEDYVPLNTTIQFLKGVGSKNISVILKDDLQHEESERFSIRGQNGAVGTVTITDDDPAPPVLEPPTKTCPDGSVVLEQVACPTPPPPVPTTKTCPNGTVVDYNVDCPIIVQPPSTVRWIAAPIRDGGYVRAKQLCVGWTPEWPGFPVGTVKQLWPGTLSDRAEYGPGGLPVPGAPGDMRAMFAVHDVDSLTNTTYVWAECLEGVIRE